MRKLLVAIELIWCLQSAWSFLKQQKILRLTLTCLILGKLGEWYGKEESARNPIKMNLEAGLVGIDG